MTRALSNENFAALQGRVIRPRDFLWIIARDRQSGQPVASGTWSGVGELAAAVVNPHTGSAEERLFYGSGTLIQISDIPLVQGVTVQNITVTMSQVSDAVNDYVRTYDCKQAEVQIFRGLFDVSSNRLVSPAVPRFVGFVDSAPITTPAAGNFGSVSFTCTSNTQELTRSNSDTRSDASQRLRLSTDTFYQDVAVVGGWELFWGKNSGTVT